MFIGHSAKVQGDADSGQQCPRCCGHNKQIHMDYRSPVKNKGWHSHSLRERVPQPLPGQAFIGSVIAYIKEGSHSLRSGLL